MRSAGASTSFVDWDPPSSGAAVTLYVLNVTGSLTTVIPTPGRALSGTVPPGTCNLTGAAVNACGSSAVTTVVTVNVP